MQGIVFNALLELLHGILKGIGINIRTLERINCTNQLTINSLKESVHNADICTVSERKANKGENMLATPENMKMLLKRHNEKIAVPGIMSYSPNTCEEYSASPGDYWDMPDNEPLKDCEGNAMILARRYSVIEPIE